MKLKIMTYNIASGREGGVNQDKISVEPMVAVAKEYMPDILGLNEVRGKNEDFTQQEEAFAEALGYKYHFFAPAITINGGGYGNALVSKYPIVDAKIIPVIDPPGRNPDLAWEEIDGKYYETRCVLKAAVMVDDEKLDVFVTHFGLAPAEQENMMELLKKLLSEKENKCILMGDFNCIPESKNIKELETFLKNIQPDEITPDFYTYASYEPDRKIDYIMVEKGSVTKKVGAVDSLASDHRAYFAEIKI